MAQRSRKPERVVYEEKPRCGRCGAEIVGVIPRWRDEKPLCRECSFELEELASKPGARGMTVDEGKTPLTPEEKRRRAILLGILAVLLLALGVRVWIIAPNLKPPRPLRHGTFETDAVTDRCIEELWRLSRQLQDGKLPTPLPLCPLSAKPYIVTETADDITVQCPNPGQHGLARLDFSRNRPIPLAQPLPEGSP